MSMPSRKRKHKTLTIKEKSEILDRINRNESMNKLASEFNVGRATIYDISKQREKIQNYVITTDSPLEKRKSLRNAGHPDMEEALYKWYLQEKNEMHISGPMLITQAKLLYKEITNKDDFAASKGWLHRFKNRFGIRLTTMATKALSDDASCVETFKSSFLQKVKEKNLCPAQVYNAVQSGFFWRIIPSEASIAEPGCDVEVRKERVIILPCANVFGTHKLKLAVIGKAKYPRSLKNIDLPVHYYGHTSEWITKDLFKQWFDECFVPEVREWLKTYNFPEKALLLLDNGFDHLSNEELTTEDKCITVMFVPSNCSEITHPMKIHNVQYVKQDYKKKLLQKAIAKDQPIEKTLQEFEIKDMVFALCQSWDSLSPSAITSSWSNLWPEYVLGVREITPLSFSKINISPEELEQVAIETQISLDTLVNWYRGVDEEQSVFQETLEPSGDDESEDEEDKFVIKKLVNVKDAIHAFEVGIQWAEENGASCTELLLLRKLRERALLSRLPNNENENFE